MGSSLALGLALVAAGSASAATKPIWVEQPPEPDKSFVYAVGQGQATTRPEAEKAALRDALDKLAAQVRVSISARTISTLSSAGSDTLSESRESVKARLDGAEPVGSPWIEAQKAGIPPFRRTKSFTAKVLLRIPRTLVERERQRQVSASKEYQKAVDRLVRETASTLRKLGGGASVAVGDFREAASGRAYTLSAILAKDVADGLVRAGITVVSKARGGLSVTGNYRVQGGEVMATARVRAADGEVLAVADTVFDKDAVEAAWLEISQPIEPFFESLEPARSETRRRFGAISIDTKPQGARVYLDGQDVGRTPLDLREVAVGKRAITLLLEGYEPHLDRLQVTEGDKAPMDVALTPKTGGLDINSLPGGVEVIVDGRARGRTPLRFDGLKLGTHKLSFKHQDYEDMTLDALVKHKEVTPVVADLVELPGSIFIISDPPGATVMIDGVEVGVAKAPKFLRVDGVRAGTRKIEVAIAGVGSWQGEVQVRARQVSQVTAEVKDRRGALLLTLQPPDAKVIIDGVDWTVRGTEVTPSSPARGATRQTPRILSEEEILRDLRERLEEGSRVEPKVLSIPLAEGKQVAYVIARGYRSVAKTIKVQPGRVTKLTVTLKPGTLRSGHGRQGSPGSLMPWTDDFAAEVCKDAPLWWCPFAIGGATAMTAGIYPLGGDLVGLPFRLIGRSYRYVADRFDREPELPMQAAAWRTSDDTRSLGGSD